MYGTPHSVSAPMNGIGGDLVDGSGTINPAALNNTNGMSLLFLFSFLLQIFRDSFLFPFLFALLFRVYLVARNCRVDTSSDGGHLFLTFYCLSVATTLILTPF